ncbi:hypothetical protein H8K90_11335 [Winogradskyella echinorum]|uniref:Uncharacterized protein n=1 Tax=Winogradskyella echinorum TaxID=538189 RepID=A0ABR6Y2P6_9FLAO|nr:hypothetical protein [Winogradskyella echinorum]MBC3846975.1 hypothetical protein [Winogradskyella echinorum]MBC5751323.1 hypothetical protein [Winogradskyella echinorum]
MKIKTLLLFLNLSLLASAQELATFCENEYGGKILKETKSIIDSLKNNGAQNFISLTHYSAGTEAGYAKILWKQENEISGIEIKINKTDNELYETTKSSLITDQNFKTIEFLNGKKLNTNKELNDMCEGWISHQPYFLLYYNNSENEECLSIPQSNTECNIGDYRIKIIEELSLGALEFLKLRITEEEFQKLEIRKN